MTKILTPDEAEDQRKMSIQDILDREREKVNYALVMGKRYTPCEHTTVLRFLRREIESAGWEILEVGRRNPFWIFDRRQKFYS